MLVVRDGRVVADRRLVRRPAIAARPELPSSTTAGRLILPGFIDTHIHYPQSDIIASYGEQLLEWLDRYTFPTERRFADPAHAREVASFFLDELLRNGTTSAMVFATVHPESVDAIFEEARARGMCDRRRQGADGPQLPRVPARYGGIGLRAERGADRALARPRPVAATRSRRALRRHPPTASSSSPGRLLDEHPGVLMQTHVAENMDEVRWVAELFPWSRSYLDVYDHFGLLRRGAVYAHCIHLDGDGPAANGRRCGAAMSFCATSNLFLGSGLFDLDAARDDGVAVGIGTDVGGGTSFSMLRTLAESYKVAQLARQRLSPLRAFYLATLGGARALGQEERLGNFAPGKPADFVVLDPAATPLMARRMARADGLVEALFVLMMLGDDRAVAATYVMGEARWRREA